MKRIIAAVTALMLLLLSVACTFDNGNGETDTSDSAKSTENTDNMTGDPNTEAPEAEDPVSENGYLLINEGKSVFDIVRPENRNTCTALISSGTKLFTTLKTLSSGTPSIHDDYLEMGQTKDGYEILIGATNRDETAAAKEKHRFKQDTGISTPFHHG